MGKHRQETGLGDAGALHLGEEPRLLDADGRLRGDAGDNALAAFRERPGPIAAKHQGVLPLGAVPHGHGQATAHGKFRRERPHERRVFAGAGFRLDGFPGGGVSLQKLLPEQVRVPARRKIFQHPGGRARRRLQPPEAVHAVTVVKRAEGRAGQLGGGVDDRA